MSSTETPKELKAGHPPAVKAGGMRVARPRHNSAGEAKDTPMTKEEQEEYGTSPPKADRHNQQVYISGVVTKGDRDFTPDAVKHFHEKQQPSKNKGHVSSKHHIQQPK